MTQAALTALGGFMAASSGFWFYLRNRVETKDREQDATTRLLMGLAQEKIMHLGLKYIDRGYITKDEYKDLRHYLLEPYLALGGNGTIERVMHGVERLEFRSNNPLADIPIRGSDLLKETDRHRISDMEGPPFTGRERRRRGHD